MPRLAEIAVYPVKALPGLLRAEVSLAPGGALEGDRRYALVAPDGGFVNGKRHPVALRLAEGWDGDELLLRSARLPLADPDFARRLAEHATRALGFPVRVEENTGTGFPDDLDSPGPTVVSRASLEEVGRWFGLPLDEVRRRFRANLELDEAEAFWEDRLVGDTKGEPRPFTIGEVRLLGDGVCQRCTVPARDARTSAPDRGFQAKFMAERARALPAASPRGRFDHFYRLAINTRPASAGTLRVGDPVAL